MIRDPSDGSVRPPLSEALIEAVKREAKKPPGPDLDHEPTRKFMVGEYDTGIRQPVRTDAQERLERSRAWLKQYHARKDEPHARGNFGGEDSKDGHSGDDQGQAEPGISDRADHGAHRQG